MPHSITSAAIGSQGRISKPCTDSLFALATSGIQCITLQEDAVTCNDTSIASAGGLARAASEACADWSSCIL
eukprot:Skav203498  [mRNA]  locus=scaffold2089:86304:88059:- [translate_table: standard]